MFRPDGTALRIERSFAVRVIETLSPNVCLPAESELHGGTVAMPHNPVCAKFSKTAVAPAEQLWAPDVGPALLMEHTYLPFAAFLSLPGTHQRFGSGDLHTLLRDLEQAREFQYFGLKIERFREHKIWSHKQLTRYVRRAYRGSTRGVRYWGRLAKILWLAYEDLERMRYWAQRTRACEIERHHRQTRRADQSRARSARRRAALAARSADKSAKSQPKLKR